MWPVVALGGWREPVQHRVAALPTADEDFPTGKGVLWAEAGQPLGKGVALLIAGEAQVPETQPPSCSTSLPPVASKRPVALVHVVGEETSTLQRPQPSRAETLPYQGIFEVHEPPVIHGEPALPEAFCLLRVGECRAPAGQQAGHPIHLRSFTLPSFTPAQGGAAPCSAHQVAAPRPFAHAVPPVSVPCPPHQFLLLTGPPWGPQGGSQTQSPIRTVGLPCVPP